jgi:anaerobic selenocysteine-containing dehydrogenase
LVNENRAILIEGNPVNPVNRGGICALGSAGLQFLYAPYRVGQPVKQTKKRGDVSGFQPVSWEEALGELGKKLGALRSEGKSHTIACITSSRQSSMDDLWLQFLTAYGSANLFKMPSPADNLKLAALLTTGNESPFAFSLEKAGLILSFGASLLEGCAAPNLSYAAVRQWTQNGKGAPKVVQVASRCSISASKADQWVAVAPGTEAALALGIAHLMVTSGDYDKDFVQNNVFGFEDWTDAGGKKHQGFKSVVSSGTCSPEEIAGKTGVDPARIRELAKEFAAQKNAVALWGIGQSEISNNTYHDLIFVALNALKGNLKTGGPIGIASDVPLAPLPAVQKDAIAENAAQQPRLDLAKTKPFPVARNGLYAFLDTVVSGPKYPIQMLFVHESNPAYSLAENKVFQNAAEKIGTIVSFSSYMDETASQADWILPNHTALERLDDVVAIPGAAFAYYAVSNPILKPLGKTKHAGEILLSLAAGMGGTVAASLPWKTYEDFLKFRVNGIGQAQTGAVADKPGVDIAKLAAGESLKPNFKDGAELWKKLKAGFCWYDAPANFPEFKSASGKLELACQLILEKEAGAEDIMCLPHFAPLKLSGSETDFPFLLVSYSAPFLTSGYLPNPPFINKLIPDSMLQGLDLFVEINPQTAKSLGLESGQNATLKTPGGEAAVLVNVTPAARPGVVYMPTGLGHKAYDEYVQNKGVNANSLVEVQLDPVSGMGTVWATRAQLLRV